MDRRGSVDTSTRESQGRILLLLDRPGLVEVKTPFKMLTHLLEQIGQHGRFGLEVEVSGDVEIRGNHHTVEDTGIRLGQAFDRALGDRAGIVRMWDSTVPLDEARTKAVIDLAARPHFELWPADIEKRLGDKPAEDLTLSNIFHFFDSMAINGRFGLHLVIENEGRDGHHIAECMTKAFARTMHFATREDPTLAGAIASTKGVM